MECKDKNVLTQKKYVKIYCDGNNKFYFYEYKGKSPLGKYDWESNPLNDGDPVDPNMNMAKWIEYLDCTSKVYIN